MRDVDVRSATRLGGVMRTSLRVTKVAIWRGIDLGRKNAFWRQLLSLGRLRKVKLMIG